MSLLDTLPGALAAVFAPLFEDATLTQTSATAPDGQGGAVVATTVETPCKARFETQDDARRAGGLPRRQRSLLVLAATLGPAIPAIGDTLTIAGQVWTVIEAAVDPAGAVWTLQARG